MTDKLVIDSLRDLTGRIREFTLRPADGAAPPAHDAGSHLKFDLGPLGERSYSLVDWPGDSGDVLRIAVQREDEGDGGSRQMHSLAVGDTLAVTGPKNDFPLQDHTGPALLVAGGIGITPILSMATALQAAGRPFALHYASRNRGVMAYEEALAEAFGAAAQFHHDDIAPLNLSALFAHVDPATHVYVCGPKPMIEATRAAANAAGLPDAQIHFELFTSAQHEAGDTAFEVEIASTGEVFLIPPDKTIIEVLEEGGMDLIYDCQRGDCGICQTDVISGIPDHRDVVLSDAEKAEGKLMQICVSRAKSARLVLDL
ncbi:PDR/VanB family oxidoreductase [Pseudodonghicola flavimaris]|uniref:PDR/VanB family oxidoreductase n=1 Tax=Pseudodonghicola flavimaris TaxID=3050036 RepID=A0ABT7F7U0_9RHOB|nr:PDR/VanB family oxidoreductase [Pseudodonghicola flavimaris]MDK3020678.1 PDR/VanB family oxidoreductase [Pseudodonghicola flavimaris]